MRQKNESGRSRSTLRCEAPRLRATTSAKTIAGIVSSGMERGQQPEPACRVHDVEHGLPEPLLVDKCLPGAPERPCLVMREPVVEDRPGRP
jgi:hypothetical protein